MQLKEGNYVSVQAHAGSTARVPWMICRISVGWRKGEDSVPASFSMKGEAQAPAGTPAGELETGTQIPALQRVD